MARMHAECDLVKVPLGRLEDKIRARSDFLHILAHDCKPCSAPGKFYMPNPKKFSVRFMKDVMMGRKQVCFRFIRSWFASLISNRSMFRGRKTTRLRLSMSGPWLECLTWRITSPITMSTTTGPSETTSGRFTILWTQRMCIHASRRSTAQVEEVRLEQMRKWSQYEETSLLTSRLQTMLVSMIRFMHSEESWMNHLHAQGRVQPSEEKETFKQTYSLHEPIISENWVQSMIESIWRRRGTLHVLVQTTEEDYQIPQER